MNTPCRNCNDKGIVALDTGLPVDWDPRADEPRGFVKMCRACFPHDPTPTTEQLCTCPIGDLGLQVHFPRCGDPGWEADDAVDVAEVSA